MPSIALKISPLSFPLQPADPFLFAAYHNDAYPKGTATMAPAASLAGRAIGQDFSGKDGWSMYHGQVHAGFPQHPHRGFETVTIVRQGFVDHSDSLGATARFGPGDVQWLTAGKGIVHCEMFPLLQQDRPNPLDLFQIWLNLPANKKFASPYFSMLWKGSIPVHQFRDAEDRLTEVTQVAGALNGVAGPTPPPDSWASDPRSDLAIWTLRMAPHAQWTLPASQADTRRNLCFFKGHSMRIEGQNLPVRHLIQFQGGPVSLINGPETAELLLLQGRPIGEPVVQYGPFVMNTNLEIQQTLQDYRRTGFGGWPWPDNAPLHPAQSGRFARYPDGRVIQPQGQE